MLPRQFTMLVMSCAGVFACTGRHNLTRTGDPMTLNPQPSSDAVATGTNRSFEHTAHTAAGPEGLWALWTEPNGWSRWDGGLRSASLGGPFVPGAEGTIQPLSGPPSRFRVVQVDPIRSCTFETSLPLAKLRVVRSLTPGGGRTTFTHAVSFHGPLAFVWARLFGPGFRRELSATMARLAELAERGH
jgi:hypothetical protein